jgi:cobalt-precorrin 5A hydrolase
MCAYYEDSKQKIKKDDLAIYEDKSVKIVSVKHVKSDKTMDIEYEVENSIEKFNIPYNASVKGLFFTKKVVINEMGSEVVEGFKCKPKNFDPNRAIMHYKSIFFICDGKRCSSASKLDRATHLRDILKEMGLNKGKNRIKISRTGCYGACRFRQVCHIGENTQANGNSYNNSLWLKHVHRLKDNEWREIFTLLSKDEKLTEKLDSKYFIDMKVYE